MDQELVYSQTGHWPTYHENEYEKPGRPETDEYRTWIKALEAGRSYMVGSQVSMDCFVKSHKTPVQKWMREIIKHCFDNPKECVKLNTHRLMYVFRRRGEYVEFGLPHQDHGGEKYWITKDNKTKILVNVD